MKIEVQGVIDVSEGQQEIGSNPPVIIQFHYVEDLNDLNKFKIVFSVKDCSKLILIQTINGISTSTDVSGKNEWFGIRDRKFPTVFQLKAINTNSITFSGYITVGLAIIQIDTEIVPLAASFVVSRVADTSSGIIAIVTIDQVEGFEIGDLREIKLYYRMEGSESWKILSISIVNPKIIKDTGGNISKYNFELQGVNIERNFIGGYFVFYVKIITQDSNDFISDFQTVFFENIQIAPSKKGTQTFPKAEILDAKKPALLRYEIKTKFSEEFVIQSNSKKLIPTTNSSENVTNDKSQFFLNAEEVAELTPDKLFHYASIKKDGETKGYMFPACVSEILPCILLSKLDASDDQKSKLIILFWKINDDFFNYTFLSGQVSVITGLLVVKVQYKNSSGTYIDLTKEITLTQEEHYNPKDNKFVLRILREDVLNFGLFDLINESDNYSDNLRILIVKHEVDCSTSNGPNNPGAFKFNKLLMPHEWKYICYDKFLGKNAAARIGEKLSLGLDSPYLRGIRLPEKGFACFDKLTDVLTYQTLISVLEEYRSDLSIFYKLSSVVEVVYFDPILQGAVNSIELQGIPDDAFLIPPDLIVKGPNLITSGLGSEKAEGIVRLNEYGKISSIELTSVGQGYSQYKTIQSAREQSESDFVPSVLMKYIITNKNLNINKQFLNIKNLSFDADSLKASLKFGVRLNNVSEDIAKYEDGKISADQKIKIKKYLENNFIEGVEVENNSVAPYVTTSNRLAPETARFSDPAWDIISKLYPENSSNLDDGITISSQDLDPGVGDLEGYQDPPLAGSSKDSSSITATPSSSPNLNYSSFDSSNLKIIPGGNVALSIASKSANPPWLTIVPLSERADGAIGYGALPNMAPRAEMFNRLARAVNALTSVRVITPLLAKVKETTTEESWSTPVKTIHGSERVSFSQSGTYKVSTSTSETLVPADKSFGASAQASVNKQGNFIISSYSSSQVSYKYVTHPLFSNITAHLNTKDLSNIKFITQIQIDKGSPAIVAANTVAGKPYMFCREGGSSNTAVETNIDVSAVPSTIENSSITFGYSEGTITAEAEKSASSYALFRGIELNENSYCQSRSYSFVKKTIVPSSVGFYPIIIDA